MNYQPEKEAVVTENKNYTKAIFGISLLMLVGFGVYAGYDRFIMPYFNPVLVPEPTTLETYGLGMPETGTSSFAGNLFYMRQTIDTDSLEENPIMYQYNVAEQFTDIVSHQNFRSFTALNAEEAVVLAMTETSTPIGAWQPYLYNAKTESLTELPHKGGYNVRDIAVSPNGLRYAYSYQVTDGYDTDTTQLAGWNIAIHTFGFPDEVDIIEGAAEPEWLELADSLLYMKQDGLYLYKIGARESVLVSQNYIPYNINSDFAVSPATKKLIVTNDIPLLRVAALFDLASTDRGGYTATEVARLVTDTTQYTQPVFSPDGSGYAVLATTFSATPAVPQSGMPMQSGVEKIAIEMRGVTDLEPTLLIPFASDDQGRLHLSSWSGQ